LAQADYGSVEYQQNIRNIHRHTEDGFLPLFQPNKADPMYSKPTPAIQFLSDDNPPEPPTVAAEASQVSMSPNFYFLLRLCDCGEASESVCTWLVVQASVTFGAAF
jgi:hypothetical protein